jgi:DNA invertase Pin-like site-specific DNA recombinase
VYGLYGTILYKNGTVEGLNMKLGYARVSTLDQNLDRQLDQLKDHGCERIYNEKITGTKRDRPELEKLLEQLRPGDIIYVSELSRLSRSVKDLFQIVDIIKQKEANLKSLKEPWADTTTPQGKLMFTIFAGISQFDRDLTSERTKEGLASARARGRKGGRPSKNPKDIEMALKMYDSKEYSIHEIIKAAGLSKTSLYRYIESKNQNSLTENKNHGMV